MPVYDLALFLAALAAAGLFAGFIGGLFGIGGGIVLVPVLHALFQGMGVPAALSAHIAVATSLATIIATSARSLSAHAKTGAVDFAIIRAYAPWIGLGGVLGAVAAHFTPGEGLLAIFGVFALFVAARMAFGRTDLRLLRDVPSGPLGAFLGLGLGIASAMMGVGGGVFGVMVMTFAGRSIHQAVATASGFGMAIALPGTLAYMAQNWGAAGAPPLTIGYVNAPGAVVLSLLTIVTAPLGARLAHRLPQRPLRLAFAAFLTAMAVKMLADAAGL